MVQSINPATGEVVGQYEEHTEQEVNRRLAAAAEAQSRWKRASFTDRSAPMTRAAALLREQSSALARLMALEMGKPVAQGRAEVEKCAGCCEFFGERAQQFLTPEIIETPGARTSVVCQPLGALLAIMPWNFPLWQAFRAAVPALMAGNAVMLKHASNVFGCALAIERLFAEAGLPSGLFSVALVGSKRVEALIAHPQVHAVTLTGSTEAGKRVAEAAGRHLKKCVLELGGSDPYVVLEDADLDAAAATCATARLINSGQSCIAAKRFIVARRVRQEFEQKLVAELASRAMGDPLKEETQIGPQARMDLCDSLHDQVTRSLRSGARLLLGGKPAEGAGAFYPATVLTDVRPGMAAFDEETFGPVAAIAEAADEAEALSLANQTQFGLGAAIFTRDAVRGERIAAEHLDAGCCFVNEFVRSDVRLPFGGIKESGFGRELGRPGIREFVNVKTVWVKGPSSK